MAIAKAETSPFYGLGLTEITATREPPAKAIAVPTFEFREARYRVRLANCAAEIDEALRLRFEVFNVELGEGLDASFITGRDEDRFDARCNHLIVLDNETDKVVGTYRLQTLESAGAVFNFYCAGEFELESLPPSVLAGSLEIGRACIAREHRSSRVLFLLWKGLVAYAAAKRKRYLFGCCSITSQDPADGLNAARQLTREDLFHPEYFVSARTEYECVAQDWADDLSGSDDYELPKLFRTYLRFGAKVCSRPAIDHDFKTIDFFVLFDLATMDDKHRRMFCA